MLMQKVKILFLLLFVASFSVIRATESEVKWTIPIKDLGMTPDKMFQFEPGILILNEGKSYVGFDTKNQIVVWRYNGIDSIKPIEGTTLLRLHVDNTNAGQKTLSVFTNASEIGQRVILIDEISGKEILDTKKEKLRVESFYLMNDINAVLLEASTTKRRFLYYIDLTAKAVVWKQDVGASGAASMFNAFGVSPDNRYMLLDGEEQLVFINGKVMTRLNRETGEIIWNTSFKNRIDKVSLLPDEKLLFFGYQGQTTVDVISITDASKLLDKPLKIRGNFLSAHTCEGNVLVATTMSVNIFSPATKAFLWEKMPTLGAVSKVHILDSAIITINETQPKDSYVYFVDFDGTLKWHRYLDKLYAYDFCEQGIFYVTPGTFNIMNFANEGKNLWSKDYKLMTGKSYFHYNRETKELALLSVPLKKSWFNGSGASLYKCNMAQSECNILANNITFENKDDAELRIEITESADNYSLNTVQELLIFNKTTGAEVYRRNYPTVGNFYLATLKREGFKGRLEDFIFGEETEIRYQKSGENGPRRIATQTNQNRLFVMTDGVNSDGKTYPCILAVDKATGNTLSAVFLTNVNPKYFVDTFDNALYLLLNEEMICYSL